MLSDPEFQTLLTFYDRPWSGYRKVRKGVKKRLRRHMNQLGCTTIEAYLQFLQKHPKQAAICQQHLLVTISRFFRDRGLWQFLREHLLPNLTRKHKAPARFWSAGCACGEEPYSLAMLWASLFDRTSFDRTSFDRTSAAVVATDVHAACLERARLGIYRASSLKEMPHSMRFSYLTPCRGGRQWRIRRDKLPAIQWQQRDLFDKPPNGPFHIIFIRNNLLTYHRGLPLQSALDNILSVLLPGGWLVVGSHETLPPSFSFLARDPSCPWVYQLPQ